MIDLHCHILHGIDDGPESIEISIEMAKIAVADGITKIVATPHIKNTICPPELIRERVKELTAKLGSHNIPVKILPGAEVYALQDRQTIFKRHTINNSNYILVEFPHSYFPRNGVDILFNLTANGLRPIISHPERNPSIIDNPARLVEMSDSGVLVQITAGSLTGHFGPDCRECALYLLRKGIVDFIATDAHSVSTRRPVLSDALEIAEKVVGKENAMKLVVKNPEAVITGKKLHE